MKLEDKSPGSAAPVAAAKQLSASRKTENTGVVSRTKPTASRLKVAASRPVVAAAGRPQPAAASRPQPAASRPQPAASRTVSVNSRPQPANTVSSTKPPALKSASKVAKSRPPPEKVNFLEVKGIDRPFGEGVKSRLIRCLLINWRLGNCFFLLLNGFHHKISKKPTDPA